MVLPFIYVSGRQTGLHFLKPDDVRRLKRSLCKKLTYSVPLFEKEGLGEILLDKSPSAPRFALPLFQSGR